MKYSIGNFANLRTMKPNQIPISTAMWPPRFWSFGVNESNVVIGLSEKRLSPAKIDMSQVLCMKNCPRRKDLPDCDFLVRYKKILDEVDFRDIMSSFDHVADEVRSVNSFEGEPEIVLLVYEAESNPCSERGPLIRWFAEHGVELKNYRSEEIETLFSV